MAVCHTVLEIAYHEEDPNGRDQLQHLHERLCEKPGFLVGPLELRVVFA